MQTEQIWQVTQVSRSLDVTQVSRSLDADPIAMALCISNVSRVHQQTLPIFSNNSITYVYVNKQTSKELVL